MANKYAVIFHPKAEKEYLESVEWYEDALIGLGDEFVDEIENTINRINSNPLLFPIKKFQMREAVVKKFPFVIVFQLKQKEKQIFILSVFHTSRNPKKKLKK
jgi:mRNA-degrading endonuclease RelE of RelBE toxin-antitoxin system